VDRLASLSNINHSKSDHVWNRSSRSSRDAALWWRVSLGRSVARPRSWSSGWHGGQAATLESADDQLGRKEHDLDYFIETSWWAALAYHFHASGQIRYAYVIFAAFFVFDRLERAAKRAIQQRIGRNLDDFAPFDRLVRIVAGRRNIYTWLFTFFLVIGAPATGFIWLCFWGVVSAVVHIVRALQIGFTGPR